MDTPANEDNAPGNRCRRAAWFRKGLLALAIFGMVAGTIPHHRRLQNAIAPFAGSVAQAQPQLEGKADAARDAARSRATKVYGRVLDESGAPVANANVYLYSSITSRVLGQGLSAVDGNIAVPVPPEDSFYIYAIKPGFAWGGAYFKGEPRDIMLATPVRVAGRVIDRSGKGVAGAIIRPMRVTPANSTPGSGMWFAAIPETGAITDDAGAFTLDALPAHSTCELRIAAPDGFANTNYPVKPGATLEPPQDNLVIELFPESKMKGKIVHEKTGQPAPGAIISLRLRSSTENVGMGLLSEATADSHGEFNFSHLRPGQYDLSVRNWNTPILPGPRIFLKQGETTDDVRVEWTDGIAVNGTVLDGATNTPVAGATLDVYLVGSPSVTTTEASTPGTAVRSSPLRIQADDTGKFTFQATPGMNNVTVSCDGYDRLQKTCDISAPTTLPPFSLTRLQTVRVLVVNPSGAPVPSATVSANGAEATTDQDGRASWRISPKFIRMPFTIRSSDGKLAGKFFLPDAGETEARCKLEPLGALKGTVESEDGTLIPGATVQAFRTSSNYQAVSTSSVGPGAITNAHGQFVIADLIPNESYRVQAKAPGYGVNSKFFSTTYYVVGGAELETDPIWLMRGDSIVAGRVCDAKGTPQVDVTITIESAHNGERSARTGTDGKFLIKDVVAESIKVTIPNGKGGTLIRHASGAVARNLEITLAD